MNNYINPISEVLESLRIVVATDLQPRSDLALRRAIALANDVGARLTVVHAVPKMASKSKERTRKNSAFAQVLSAVDEAAVGRRSELVEIDVRVGKPLEAISAVARDINADLIVIAAPQARRLDSIVGTSAERLIRATQRPVLVVRRESHDVYRTAAVATDLAAGSVSLLHTAARFGIFDRTHMTVFHAFDPPFVGALRSAGVPDAEIISYYREWQNELKLKAHDNMAAAGVSDLTARVMVQRSRPGEALQKMLEQEQPDLLVMGASRWFLTKRLLVGSVADEVLRTASCDVLVIPRKLAKAYISRVRRTAPKPEAQKLERASSHRAAL
jgi:nucleotide-binding universal stress UspA family protein